MLDLIDNLDITEAEITALVNGIKMPVPADQLEIQQLQRLCSDMLPKYRKAVDVGRKSLDALDDYIEEFRTSTIKNGYLMVVRPEESLSALSEIVKANNRAYAMLRVLTWKLYSLINDEMPLTLKQQADGVFTEGLEGFYAEYDEDSRVLSVETPIAFERYQRLKVTDENKKHSLIENVPAEQYYRQGVSYAVTKAIRGTGFKPADFAYKCFDITYVRYEDRGYTPDLDNLDIKRLIDAVAMFLPTGDSAPTTKISLSEARIPCKNEHMLVRVLPLQESDFHHGSDSLKLKNSPNF